MAVLVDVDVTEDTLLAAEELHHVTGHLGEDQPLRGGEARDVHAFLVVARLKWPDH